MKICNVTPGLLPIPPNGWGAVEKIIWETHLCLIEMGHTSKICYLDEVDGTDDIVHIHVANLANIAHERGIKYVFTLHDHHAYLYGKESQTYLENKRAIDNAEIAFVPAKFLLDYFENPKNLFYFSHGVNTLSFKESSFSGSHSLLCVANNGFIHDQSEDRKGFTYAIEAAKLLNLPITIVGPENNRNFFSKFPQDYDKLTIKYNLSEDELIEEYSKHTIFVHPSILEAGHPNLTLLEAIASCLPVVATFEEDNFLSGLIRIERSVESVHAGIQEAILNYDRYKIFCKTSSNKLNWKNRVKELLLYYKKIKDMKEELINAYENIPKLSIESRKAHPKFNYNFVNGAFFEILGNGSTQYKVEFIDQKNNLVVYSTTMNGNCWAKCNREYLTDWLIRADDGEDQYEYYFDLREKRILLSFESKSIGDTFAWIPIARQFKEKYDCEVIVSTFHNSLFEKAYPELQFVSPGKAVNDLFGSYTIGYWYSDTGPDLSKHPKNPFTRPLQAAASDILGIDYVEERPRLYLSPELTKEIEGDYICIAPHSTAQAKYWNFPGGWQQVIDYYNSCGYKVVYVSQEDPDSSWTHQNIGELRNIVKRNGLPLERVLADIKYAKAFIGLGSGLSWAAWACETPVTLISGFSDPISEFSECQRVINTRVCNSCWNRTLFDRGDWQWCPDHKGTYRQFECTKAISPHEIIHATDLNLHKDTNKIVASSEIDERGYWDPVFAEKNHVHSELVSDWICAFLSESKDIPVIDFGCGMGTYLNELYLRGHKYALGIEAIPPKNDYEFEIKSFDLTKNIDLGISGNVISLEVGEHIPAKFMDAYLDNITKHCTKYLILSWALRGQGGHGHFNELNNDEVIPHIVKRGFEYLEKESFDARKNVEDPFFYFRNSIMIFKRI